MSNMVSAVWEQINARQHIISVCDDLRIKKKYLRNKGEQNTVIGVWLKKIIENHALS